MTSSRRPRIVLLLTALAVVALALSRLPGAVGSSDTPATRSPLRGITINWPSDGQSAIWVGDQGRRVSPGQSRPLPIASVAKIMTAYVVVRRDPLADGGDGFVMTLDQEDADVAADDAAQGQSFVSVEAGEVITEREALEALLLPSANNIAMALANHVAGSVPAFVALMNQRAAALGMRHTTYTDPSGYAPTTMSTAADQLRLGVVALRDPTIASILSLSAASIPAAGDITTTNTLLGRDGIVGGKTGSDLAAGGCFMFRAIRQVRHHSVTVVGVVLGQQGDGLIQSGLDAADGLLNDVVQRLGVRHRHRP
jgi:D-alanyl-D-alanine carboxypeptidase (penicillin-binding protein 5/6)